MPSNNSKKKSKRYLGFIVRPKKDSISGKNTANTNKKKKSKFSQWIRRKTRKSQQRFRRMPGFKKKVFAVIMLFIFGFLLVGISYLIWFERNEDLITNYQDRVILLNEDISLATDSLDSFYCIIKNSESEKILDAKYENTLINKKQYENTRWSIPNFLIFLEEKDGFLGVILSFFALTTIIVGFYKWNKFELFTHLYSRHKEKIKILNRFSSDRLIGNRSIYKSIIDLLKRCDDLQKEAISSNEVTFKMLLCSPLLDYAGRETDFDKWGQQFYDLIESISHSNKVSLNLYYLPDIVIGGINPLNSFNEVLANHYYETISHNYKCADDIFETIKNRTERLVKDFKNLSENPDKKVKINTTLLNDIPFQIIIYRSKNLNEVIVSFAGKKILEDNKVREPYGFHSVDIDVVETFDNIFESYVQPVRRKPIKPIYTESIIDEIRKEGRKRRNNGKHTISNYLDLITNNTILSDINEIAFDLSVNKGIFSPAFANSSKFVSYSILPIITKDDCILDIGSGTGVQSILSFKILKKLGTRNPKVYSLESHKKEYDNLEDNLKRLNLLKVGRREGIRGLRGELKLAPLDKNNPDELGGVIEDEDGNRRILPSRVKFSLVIADLPFIDTLPGEDTLEKSFYNNDHDTHKALFDFFKNNNHIKADAKLITSFSSIGGEGDMSRFEMLINESGLISIQKNSYNEDGFQWIVYCIMKKEDIDYKNYWRQYLNCIKP